VKLTMIARKYSLTITGIINIWYKRKKQLMEKLHRDITFFLALASFLLLVACNVNTKENDWAKFNLNGKVKFIKESSFKAIDRFGEI
jgi:hypothetical protein